VFDLLKLLVKLLMVGESNWNVDERGSYAFVQDQNKILNKTPKRIPKCKKQNHLRDLKYYEF
jgi:hypothetical protein